MAAAQEGAGHRDVVVLGGSETAARGLDEPWPARLGRRLGREVVSLGRHNASAQAFLADPQAVAAARGAGVAVVVAMGAANLSNRLYEVHPRRNDRFLRPSGVLQVLFPEVDFAEICFTRHLLLSLHRAAPDRWPIVREELRMAWLARMRALLGRTGPALLLHLPGGGEGDDAGHPEGPEPLLVTDAMVAALRPLLRDVVTLPAAGLGGEALHERVAQALEGPVAALLPPPEAARAIA